MSAQNPNCPECADSLAMPTNPMAGEILSCGACGVELEVTTTTPLAVAVAPEIEEDWGE